MKKRSEPGGELLAPEDWLLRDALLAGDGRKQKDADHVGALCPDSDPDESPPPSPPPGVSSKK